MFSSSTAVFGPIAVVATINQDPDDSAQHTLSGQQARDLIALAGLSTTFIVSRARP
jgi:hypothetical protein